MPQWDSCLWIGVYNSGVEQENIEVRKLMWDFSSFSLIACLWAHCRTYYKIRVGYAEVQDAQVPLLSESGLWWDSCHVNLAYCMLEE